MSLARLEDYFRSQPPMAVAVSGGVDSMTLAVVASRVRPETRIFHAISPAVPAAATARVRSYARSEKWRLTVVDAGEMADENYLNNPANRCYFCKTNLYQTVSKQTDLLLASGTNLDDLDDYRPGLIAAEEQGVCHPYVELDIDKANLRLIAAELLLNDLKELPAAPCLSSRVTTGIVIDPGLLPIVDVVEEAVRQRLMETVDLKAVRCRIREREVGLQIDTNELLGAEIKAELIVSVREIFAREGYGEQATHVVIEPYKKGSAFLLEAIEVAE